MASLYLYSAWVVCNTCLNEEKARIAQSVWRNLGRTAVEFVRIAVFARRPIEDFVTVDAGFKAFSTDRGYGPEVLGHEGAGYRWGGDEFGYVDGAKAKLGERVRFLPPHCDPTVNLHDRIYACRGERVEAVWPVKRLTL